MGAGGRVLGVGYPPPVIARLLLASFVLFAMFSKPKTRISGLKHYSGSWRKPRRVGRREEDAL